MKVHLGCRLPHGASKPITECRLEGVLSKMGAATLYFNGSTVEQSLISTGLLESTREKLSNSTGPVQLQIGANWNADLQN